MFPDQQNQNPYNQPPQQHSNGQYEVVPPMPAGGNAGHTGHNPYEFIMNPNAPKKRAFGTGKMSLVKIGVLLGGLIVVVVVIAIIASALAPKSSTPNLIAIAQRQQEIIRVSGNAGSQTSDQDVANLVANVNASIASSQQEVVTYLAGHGTKLNPKILALDQDPQTDTLLQNAANANNYDSAVAQDLAQQLKTYEDLLQTTFSQTASKQTKQLLQGCFTSAGKLLQQAKALPANSDGT